MNTQQNKTQDLLKILETLESCYNTNSPDYKFSHVFYNIVDFTVERPPTFPVDLWNKYYIPDCPLMPVILNRVQIEERKEQQKQLAEKLNESKASIQKKVDALRVKRELVKNKLEKILNIFKEKTKKYVHCDSSISLAKIQTDVLEREKYVIRTGKEELLNYLQKMNERLQNLENKVKECAHTAERKYSIVKKLK